LIKKIKTFEPKAVSKHLKQFYGDTTIAIEVHHKEWNDRKLRYEIRKLPMFCVWKKISRGCRFYINDFNSDVYESMAEAKEAALKKYREIYV